MPPTTTPLHARKLVHECKHGPAAHPLQASWMPMYTAPHAPPTCPACCRCRRAWWRRGRPRFSRACCCGGSQLCGTPAAPTGGWPRHVDRLLQSLCCCHTGKQCIAARRKWHGEWQALGFICGTGQVLQAAASFMRLLRASHAMPDGVPCCCRLWRRGQSWGRASCSLGMRSARQAGTATCAASECRSQ